MSGVREKDEAHAPTVASSPDVGGMTVNTSGTTDPHEVDPLIGQVIAERYQVLSLLGKGGMGSVYVCEHIQLKKRMALKMLAEELRKQPALVTRFLKEARAAAQIGHPNIVDVYDLGELPGGGAYIAMALLDGEDLQSELVSSGILAFPRARVVVGQICRALAAAHSKGIVHRDMKPANVFIARDADGTESIKILDFGIAQVNEVGEGEAARLTQTGAIVGTPAFMSPEQGRGARPDHRTDIYSVGCILYNLITGVVPFEGATLMGVISQHLFDPPVPPSQRAPDAGLTPEIDALVLRAMAKDPAERFQTMKEMWTALEACSADPMAWPDPNSGRYDKLPPKTPVPPSRAGLSRSGLSGMTADSTPRTRRGLLLAIGLGLGVAGAVLVWERIKPPTPTAERTTTPAITPTTTGTPAPVPPVVAHDVVLEIHTTPAGARVLDGDKPLGETPLKLVRKRSDETLSLRIALAGHAEETLSLPSDRDKLVELRLEPIAPPSAPPSKPSRPETPHRPAIKKAGKSGDLKDPFAR
jgi:eukaryotic-like serine/threonine-protein kinase